MWVQPAILQPVQSAGGDEGWSVAPFLLGRESGDCVRFVLPLPAARLPALQQSAEAQGARRSARAPQLRQLRLTTPPARATLSKTTKYVH
jgi:hypothetical protein